MCPRNTPFEVHPGPCACTGAHFWAALHVSQICVKNECIFAYSIQALAHQCQLLAYASWTLWRGTNYPGFVYLWFETCSTPSLNKQAGLWCLCLMLMRLSRSNYDNAACRVVHANSIKVSSVVNVFIFMHGMLRTWQKLVCQILVFTCMVLSLLGHIGVCPSHFNHHIITDVDAWDDHLKQCGFK